MAAKTRRQKQAQWLRRFRKIHRWTGASLFVFFFVVSVTGLLLGWKKNSKGVLLAPTAKGTSTELAEWLPLEVLHDKACIYLHDSISPDLSLELDRIDVRQSKGIVKFIFVDYHGLQLDGATGELLTIERRRSDFIENVHDGSVLDHLFGTDGQLKLLYSTIMGLALLTFTVTGFWLWYGPKRMRRGQRD